MATAWPVRDRWIFAPPDAAHADGAPIDPSATNAHAVEALVARREHHPDAVLVVVPGYTPVNAPEPVQLHPTALKRLKAARDVLAERQALGILVSGGNVHPDDTPYNEAWEMRRWLLEDGLAADRVVIDPYARHSTTNLRNAGRFLLAYGIPAAIVVTDFGQGFYFGAQGISTFRGRCTKELGYAIGTLDPDPGFTQVRFVPSAEVTRRGTDPLDP